MTVRHRDWAGVIGDPISQSLSPRLHQAAYRYLNLEWDYCAQRVSIADLPGFLDGLDSQCRGLSVTMPLKQELLRHVDFVDGLAKVTSAANTVVFSGANRAAFNTDVYGIAQALGRSGYPVVKKPVTVLGSGATAASALAALAQVGTGQIVLAARSLHGPFKAPAAAHRMGLEIDTVDWADEDLVAQTLQRPIIISTLPWGVADSLAERVNPRADQLLLELSYGRPSTLGKKFTEAGALVVPGVEVLIHQALAQVKLMTSKEVPAKILAAALGKNP